MTTSNSFITSSSNTTESSLHSIAQYIEDYIDLVENVPNEISRQITQLHEYNDRYHHLMRQVDSTLDILTSNGDIDEKKKRRSVILLQRYLLQVQEISDNKLFLVQNIIDQLDIKERQLDVDHRNVTMGNSTATVMSPTKSNSFTSINSLAAAAAISNNVASSSNSSNTCTTTTVAINNGLNQSLSGEDTETVQNDVSTADACSSRETSLSLSKECGNNSNKRISSRRAITSRSNDPITINESSSMASKRGIKRGSMKSSSKDVKRSKGTNRDATNSNNDGTPPLYEGAPIDPDEPTYCLCEQVSFGEMICCDNSSCQIEWFHFSCVSLTTKPKGKWFCPNCRGERSNIQKK